MAASVACTPTAAGPASAETPMPRCSAGSLGVPPVASYSSSCTLPTDSTAARSGVADRAGAADGGVVVGDVGRAERARQVREPGPQRLRRRGDPGEPAAHRRRVGDRERCQRRIVQPDDPRQVPDEPQHVLVGAGLVVEHRPRAAAARRPRPGRRAARGPARRERGSGKLVLLNGTSDNVAWGTPGSTVPDGWKVTNGLGTATELKANKIHDPIATKGDVQAGRS